MKNLRTLKLARNKIKEVNGIVNISLLEKLTNLTLLDNPLCKNVSYIEICMVFSKNLQIIDSRKIDGEMQDLLKKAVSNVDVQGILKKKDAEIEDYKKKIKGLLTEKERICEENLALRNSFEVLEQDFQLKSLQYEHKVKEIAEKIAKFFCL